MGTHPIFESDFDCLTEMGRTSEICFEAPEISMSSDITIDAILSMVTVSKLTNMSVDANCYCPAKGTGLSGNSNSNNNRAISVTPPLANRATVTKPVVAQAVPAPIQPAPVVAEPVVEDKSEDPVVVEPKATVESAPAEIPTETAGAVNTADETSAETTVNDSTADKSLLEYNTDISVTGQFASQWKTLNVPGEYELFKEDAMGRPIYKRKEPTSDGGAVYLYHIHHSKKWRVGSNHEGQDAYNCWLYITSKVDQPLLIAKDQERTKRNWKEFDTSSNKWLEVKNMKITQL